MCADLQIRISETNTPKCQDVNHQVAQYLELHDLHLPDKHCSRLILPNMQQTFLQHFLNAITVLRLAPARPAYHTAFSRVLATMVTITTEQRFDSDSQITAQSDGAKRGYI